MAVHKNKALLSNKQFSQVFFLILFLTISILFVFVIRRFIIPALLAGITAGIFKPLHKKIHESMPRLTWLSPVIAILIVFLLVVVPLGTIGIFLIRDITEITKILRGNINEIDAITKNTMTWISQLSIAQYLGITTEQLLNELNTSLQNILKLSMNYAIDISKNTLSILFNLFIFLYCLYFFFRDGDHILQRIFNFIPLHDTDKNLIVDRFASTTKATIKGSLIIGLIQGTIGASVFALLGIQGPVFWGVMIMIIAIIPIIGPAIIWVPTALLFFYNGYIGKGIIMTLVGILIMGSIEYIIRPRLIGEDTKIHDLLILFGVLGGIMVFGIFGFIIGPIIMALFVTTLNMFRRFFRSELQYAVSSPASSTAQTRNKSYVKRTKKKKHTK